MDRAHRLPKPSHVPNVSRDMIAHINFYHVKEQLVQLTRKTSPLPDPYAQITVFVDLSQFTILAGKQLISITKLLHNHGVI